MKKLGGRQLNSVLNEGQEDEMEISGYKAFSPFEVLSWLGIVLSLGFLRIIYHWWPKLMLYATHRPSPLADATKLLVIVYHKNRTKTTTFIKKVKVVSSSKKNSEELQQSFPIHLDDGTTRVVREIRYVKVKKLTYVWVKETKKFVKLVGLGNGVEAQKLFEKSYGLTESDQKIKQTAYGRNEIKVPLTPIPALVLFEILNPYYIYQFAVLILWFSEEYIMFPTIIGLLTILVVSVTVAQIHKNQRRLLKTVNKWEIVTVRRNELHYEDIPSTELVPGDVIVVPQNGFTAYCDCVLLNGTCTVNESILTGESVPVTKVSLPKSDVIFNAEKDSRHTIFCGTHVIQSRGSGRVHAVVVRTGYLTAKGQLIRYILYPEPSNLKFERDLYYFFLVLIPISFIFAVLGYFFLRWLGAPTSTDWLLAFDIMTASVPACLASAMNFGKLYSVGRLKKDKISCVNSKIVNVAGSITCICFDKTGTLTEDGLDLRVILPVRQGTVGDPCRSPRTLPVEDRIVHGLATCHSLSMSNGVLLGDPLDLIMFESIDWVLEEPSDRPTIVRPSKGNAVEISILHRFTFSSELQRMSVVTRKSGESQMTLYAKGSPEMIISRSIPSTVPKEIWSKLKEYTGQGFRVISMGWRHLNFTDDILDRIGRETVEVDLNFSALIVLENRLKPETIPTIRTLKEAQFKIVMITGDNIDTALVIARESGISKGKIVELQACERSDGKYDIINQLTGQKFNSKEKLENCELAMTGTVWDVLKENRPEFLADIVDQVVVFARMSSEKKKQVIVRLRSARYFVAMCGDGANDCGALKAANVGISLTKGDASMASPLTSQTQNISCVINVIREGRAALATSLGIFKAFVFYAFSESTSSVILLYIGDYLSDGDFTYLDLSTLIAVTLFFGASEAYKGPLVAENPEPSLFSPGPLISLLSGCLLNAIFQYISVDIIQRFSWFVPFDYVPASIDDFITESFENYSIFCLSILQNTFLLIVCYVGPPYRQRIFTNIPLMVAFIVFLGCDLFIILSKAEWVSSFFDLKYPPNRTFPCIVILLGLANFVIWFFIEKFVIDVLLLKKLGWSQVRKNESHSRADGFV